MNDINSTGMIDIGHNYIKPWICEIDLHPVLRDPRRHFPFRSISPTCYNHTLNKFFINL